MPFRTDDGRPLDELVLAERPADGVRFELREGFAYEDAATARVYDVPAGRSTDLATVPMWLWSFIASYGRQSAPAVLHDHRSAVAAALGDPAAALAQRREDDAVFRRALRDQGVPVLRRRLMWAWVAADREREFGGLTGTLLIVQVVLGAVLVVAASAIAVWHPWWLVAVPVVMVAAAPWALRGPGFAGLVLVLTASIAVLGPFLVLHLVALAPFRLVEAIVELAAGGDPASVLRPTVQADDQRAD
jgi:hypothetical protein